MMMKKMIFTALGLLLLACIGIALWWVIARERHDNLPKDAFIPDNSALVVTINADSPRLAPRWTALFDPRGLPMSSRLLGRVADSLWRHGLVDTVASTLAFRVEGQGAARTLLILDCGPLFSRGQIQDYLKRLSASSTEDYTYEGFHVRVPRDMAGARVYAALAGARVLLSDSRLYVEDALRQLGGPGDGQTDATAHYRDVTRYFSASASCNLFLSTDAFTQFLPLLLDPHLLSPRLDVSTWFDWGALDADIRPEGIHLNGFLAHERRHSSWPAVLIGQRPVAPRLDRVLPLSTRSASFLLLSDVPAYLQALDRFRTQAGQAEKNRLRRQEYVKLFGDVEKEWTAMLDGEWAAAVLSRDAATGEADGLVVARVKAGSLARELLDRMMTRYARHSGSSLASLRRSYRLDDTKQVDYYAFPVADYPAVLWGDVLDGLPARYALVEGNCLVFATSPAAVQTFSRDYARRLTLHDQDWYRRAREQLSNEANWMHVADFSASVDYYRRVARGPWKQRLSPLSSAHLPLSSIACQWATEGEMLYNTLFLGTEHVARDQAQLLWQTKLDAPLASKPAIVVNHNTGERELFVQDERHTVYLINDIGRILWRKPLDGPINSEVYQVDMYRNGKLQLLFSTARYVYLIDRNGAYLPRYPLPLASPCPRGITLCDYDGRRDYRVFIPSADRSVRLIDLSGNAVKGWNVPRCDNDMSSRVEHFRVGDKDYIVYADRYRLYILDRRGRERVNVPTLLNLSPETTLHLTRVNGRPVIALLDAEGYLLLVDFTGNVTSVPLEEAAPGGALNVADVNADGQDEFIVARGDRLLVHDARGRVLYQYRWEGARLAYPYVYRFSAADIRVGVLDRGGHRLFLTAGEGLSKGFPVSGITPFSIAFFTEGDSGFYLFSGSEAAHLLKYRVQR